MPETSLGAIGVTSGLQIGKVTVTPQVVGSTLTASATVFTTITVSKRTAGGAPVTIAQATTNLTANGGTGNWVAWVPVNIPVIAGAAVADGDVITVLTTHASNGTQIPASLLEIFPAVN